jgi:hypothetical protein
MEPQFQIDVAVAAVSGSGTEHVLAWLPAVLAVAAWPIVIVLIVFGVLVLVPREHQAAVFTGIAELVRAARSSPIPDGTGQRGDTGAAAALDDPVASSEPATIGSGSST